METLSGICTCPYCKNEQKWQLIPRTKLSSGEPLKVVDIQPDVSCIIRWSYDPGGQSIAEITCKSCGRDYMIHI